LRFGDGIIVSAGEKRQGTRNESGGGRDASCFVSPLHILTEN